MARINIGEFQLTIEKNNESVYPFLISIYNENEVIDSFKVKSNPFSKLDKLEKALRDRKNESKEYRIGFIRGYLTFSLNLTIKDIT